MIRKLSGWSKYKHYECELFKPNDVTELQNFIKNNNKGRKIIARGHGCSNGDQSVLSDGIVIDTSFLNKIINYNKQAKTIEVEAAVKLSDILRITLKDDLFFQCIPGGLDITVGGAISNNVHGKDCFKNGYFNSNVNKIKILCSSGEIVEVSNIINKEFYDNIFSSFGLLGVIISVELCLKDITSPLLKTETTVVKNKNEMEIFFNNSNQSSDYLIAWLDCSSKKKGILRGICKKALFVEKNQISPNQREKSIDKINHSLKKRKKNTIKKFLFNIIWTLISKLFGSKFFYFFNFVAFNLFKILGKQKKIELLTEFILLDEKYLPEYTILFKSNGFLTIQPFFNNNKPFDKIEMVILLCQKFDILPIWCPIKKYKNLNKQFFDFGGDGYSIVIEFSPHEVGIDKSKKFISELESLIIAQKGKIYLAKDQIISKQAFKKMYPDYKKFLSIKTKYDKHNLFISEQFIRLLT
jgi:decaprenylphospho-beta-D-ribofuranose 2-oxidase